MVCATRIHSQPLKVKSFMKYVPAIKACAALIKLLAAAFAHEIITT